MALTDSDVIALYALPNTADTVPVLDVCEYLKTCSGLRKENGMALEILGRIQGAHVEDFLLDLLETHTIDGEKRVPGFRDRIALVLGRLGCSKAAPAILRHVETYERESSLGEMAIAALGRLRVQGAVPILTRLALAGAGQKGYEAARALRLIGPDPAYPVLRQALASPQATDLRWNALHALIIIDTPEAIRIYRRTFLDKVFGRRRWCAKFLEGMQRRNVFLKYQIDEEHELTANFAYG